MFQGWRFDPEGDQAAADSTRSSTSLDTGSSVNPRTARRLVTASYTSMIAYLSPRVAGTRGPARNRLGGEGVALPPGGLPCPLGNNWPDSWASPRVASGRHQQRHDHAAARATAPGMPARETPCGPGAARLHGLPPAGVLAAREAPVTGGLRRARRASRRWPPRALRILLPHWEAGGADEPHHVGALQRRDSGVHVERDRGEGEAPGL